MGSRRWKHPALNEIDLGDITDQQQGESRDDATAAKFFLKDAERGDAGAQLNIALMLADGTGVEREPVAAYMWAELAAYRATAKLREIALKLQAHLEESLAPADIGKAKEAARRWHPKTG
ncbi:MAG TPA: hypothetical protein VI732_05765 [Alphaproteobacteria bacterium]|jgi:TPR repeat protein|nr:hypothetical protein [Alphaproteobacteria bacterium]